jgi:hypothetical protein
MTIRSGGVLTNADPGMTATLYVNGAATGNAVTVTNPSVGDYVLSYTVPTGLDNNSVLAIKVVGAIGGTGFTEWLEDQFSDLLASLDYSCIADWVLRQPVSVAETSVCTDIPAIAPDSLLYLLKYVAPHAAWFQTIVSSCPSSGSCGCGSVTCSSCNNCCY